MTQELLTSTELSRYLPIVVPRLQQQRSDRSGEREDQRQHQFTIEENETDRFERQPRREAIISSPDYPDLAARFRPRETPRQDDIFGQNQEAQTRGREPRRAIPPGFAVLVSGTYETSREGVFLPPNPGGNLDLVT